MGTGDAAPGTPPAEDGPRFLVIGTSGAGKSTFAERMSRALALTRFELDALHWLPDWQERPVAEFREAVRAAAAGPTWVSDGNYSAVREVLWPRATDVVWLNYGRWLVFWRVLRRTAARTLLRQPLWHGNRETLRMALFSRESILLWSLTTWGPKRRRYEALRREPRFAHLRWHEMRTPAEADAWLAARVAAAKAARASATGHE